MARDITVTHADGTDDQFGLAIFFGPAKNPKDYPTKAAQKMYNTIRAELPRSGGSREFFTVHPGSVEVACTECDVIFLIGPNQQKLMAKFQAEQDGPATRTVCVLCVFRIGLSDGNKIDGADLSSLLGIR